MELAAPRDEHAGRSSEADQGDAQAHRQLRRSPQATAGAVPGAERRRRRAWRSPRRCWPAEWSTRSSTATPAARSSASPGLIALIAVADAALGDLDALAVGDDRRGTDPRPAHDGVRPRAAHADRVLHAYAHGSTREPAQQRRAGGAAGVQRHALRRRQQPGDPDADAGRDDQHLVADHRRRVDPAAGLRRAGAPHGQPAGRPVA